MQAHQLALDACVVAGRGCDPVGQVVTTMQGINHSSRKIGHSITRVSDIVGAISTASVEQSWSVQQVGRAVPQAVRWQAAQRGSTAAERPAGR